MAERTGKLPIRHQPAHSDVEHERNFWQWKYERREAECEELAARLGDLLAAAKAYLAHEYPNGPSQASTYEVDAPALALFEAIDKADLDDTEEKEADVE